MFVEKNMIIVSMNTGDFIFHAADDVLKFMQTAAQEKSDMEICRRKIQIPSGDGNKIEEVLL